MRTPAFQVDGVEFPVSVAPLVSDGYLRYVKPPTNSFDWQGARWDTTALGFESKVARAEVIGNVVTICPLYEDGQDAAAAFRMMHDAVLDLAETIANRGSLADRQSRVRMQLQDGKMQLRAKTWPKIAGVTYYAEDSTL